MFRNKIFENAGNKIDGCEIFEFLAKETVLDYLGRGRAKALVFGTAVGNGFKEKINMLARELNDGGGYKDRGVTEHAKDAQIDIVAWIPFRDKSIGKLILFGQCKTGDSWQDQINQLNPECVHDYFVNFQDNTPLKAFFVSSAITRDGNWSLKIRRGGIFFDRCRIIDYLSEIPENLKNNIKIWTDGSMPKMTIN